MSNGMPIIRVEIEQIRQQILYALSGYEAELNQLLRESIERYLTPENISRVVAEQVGPVIQNVIREETEQFYKYGEGRKIIREIVRKRLMNDENYLNRFD